MPKDIKLRIWLFSYLFVGCFIYFLAFPHLLNEKLTFFFQDPSITSRVEEAISKDTNSQFLVFTRLFHNRVTFSLNTFFLSISRSIDPVYLYSLSTRPFFDSNESKPLLPFIEFPFFCIALVSLVRSRKLLREYSFILYLLVCSLLIIALFTPSLSPLKSFPLVITLRLLTFYGLAEFFLKGKSI